MCCWWVLVSGCRFLSLFGSLWFGGWLVLLGGCCGCFGGGWFSLFGCGLWIS